MTAALQIGAWWLELEDTGITKKQEDWVRANVQDDGTIHLHPEEGGKRVDRIVKSLEEKGVLKYNMEDDESGKEIFRVHPALTKHAGGKGKR